MTYRAIVGIDLGGSNIFSVAYDLNSLEILYEEKVDTEARNGYQHVINKISNLILKIIETLKQKDFEVISIGLAVPGVINEIEEIVYIAPNLGWKNVYLIQDLNLEPEIKQKIIMINDVNAGFLGELHYIEPKPQIALAYFCGTGIGGGVFIDGKLFTGMKGGAGEVGHIVIRKKGRRCQCGRRGCLEAYIGKWALNEKIQRQFIKNKPTLLKNIIDYDLSKTPIKSASLKRAYKKGDKFTKKLMQKYYAYHLGIAISQSVNLLNPEIIVLGGGIMESLGEYILPYVYKYMEKYCIVEPPTLRLSKLGDYAGVLGAALHSFQSKKVNSA